MNAWTSHKCTQLIGINPDNNMTNFECVANVVETKKEKEEEKEGEIS